MSQHLLQPLPNQVLAYTDGACRGNPGKGGFGAVVILPTGEQIDLCGGEASTTNNRMELMGAITALEHSPPDMPIQIWSDSSYVIKGITEWLAGWKRKNWKNVKNPELWQRLDAACQNRQIDWQWVKGHAGHDGNEYADQLANQGIDNLPKNFTKKIIPNPNLSVTATANATDIQPLESKKKPTMPIPMNELSNNPQELSQAMDFAQNYQEGEAYSDNYSDFGGFEQDSLKHVGIDGSIESGAGEGDAFLNLLDDEMSPNVDNQLLSPSTGQGVDFSAFTNDTGEFVAQDDGLIEQRPEFNGITSQPNVNFVPLLPLAKNAGVSNRQLILDTETTGFDAQNGDRIIEVGVVELINRKFTGEKLHVYLNPHKQMDEEVIRIHGIHNVFLDGMPTFEQVGKTLYDFLQGAELIAHNASFDMNFLQAEFARMGLPDIIQNVTVTDSLAIAKQMYAGQRNTLDALVKRLNVGKQDRTFHGALLDAEILAEVYLAMTGGQVSLAIDEMGNGVGGVGEHIRFTTPVKRFDTTTQDEAAHQAWLTSLANKYPQLASNWGMETAVSADN